MAHRCSCHCHCRCQRMMDRPQPAPIVQNFYIVSPQQVLVGPNQQIAVPSVRASVPEKTKHHGYTSRPAIKNDKSEDKHRKPRPIEDDKKVREKHRDARRQTADVVANDKKVREIHHRVKGEPKQKAHVDAKPRVKCANGGTRHKH